MALHPHHLAAVQALYYGLTALWALVHIRSFMAVTGPKTDLWLVKTVAVLIAAIAIALGWAAWRGAVAPETAVLALASAIALGGIDVFYALRGTISRIYLADAVAEAALVAAWIAALPR
jgi:hypothetical protein